jgi:hypothetical protein
LLILQSQNQTKSRNRHQLQFEYTGTRQATHRIAETTTRTGRAGAITRNYVSNPPAEIAVEAKQDGITDAAHTARPERNPKQELQLKCAGARQTIHRITETISTNGRASTAT